MGSRSGNGRPNHNGDRCKALRPVSDLSGFWTWRGCGSAGLGAGGCDPDSIPSAISLPRSSAPPLRNITRRRRVIPQVLKYERRGPGHHRPIEWPSGTQNSGQSGWLTTLPLLCLFRGSSPAGRRMMKGSGPAQALQRYCLYSRLSTNSYTLSCSLLIK